MGHYIIFTISSEPTLAVQPPPASAYQRYEHSHTDLLPTTTDQPVSGYFLECQLN
jgi:hypothetical protein